jgi:hypothetical protein
MKKILFVLAATGVAAFAAVASAQSTQAVPTARLVETYTPLAGSEQNAESLVEGLRTGSRVTLATKTSTGTTTTSFTPPTKTMGNGNVNIALSLAEASLKDQGITDPTASQLQTALMGGTIETRSGEVKLDGVLRMRADGMGWGQIASQLGFKLGDVMSAGKRPEHASRADHAARMEKPDRPARPETPERPARFERPDKPERPGR